MILAYCLIIVLGNNSPNNNIIIEIGIKVNFEDTKLLLTKYTVQNDEHNIFDKVVPINVTIRNFDLSSKILLVNLPNLKFCLIHTSICNLFADTKAISKLENIIDKNRPIIVKFNSNIINKFKSF